MDTSFRYYFEKWEGELEDDQIPEDYELEEVDGKKGRFRCCHGLIDRQNPDSLKLVRLFMQKLFEQSFSYTPSGQEVPIQVQDECRCDILNFSQSLLRDERNMSRSKFLIVVKFGALMITGSNADKDQSEIEYKEEEEEEGDRLMRENEQMRFGTYDIEMDEDIDQEEVLLMEVINELHMRRNGAYGIEMEEDIDLEEALLMEFINEQQMRRNGAYDSEMEEDIDAALLLMEVNEQVGFKAASKAAIEGLEKVSGLGRSNECVICLGMEKEEEEMEARRMPCGHVYHGDCIVRWLEKSHLCPLCRYAMPL
ncbi:hypothetical protein DITRI_Ditri03aG0087900 [Diplodiscus trichospermus]